MSFTGAANRADASGGFGQGETRPQAFTGLNGKGYLIGRTHDRIIEIADMSDPDTSTYVSAVIGNPNSMAAHNGSLYVFIGKDLIRFDTPFSDTDTGTDVFTINETPRALTSDGTNLYYIHQLSTLNFLYRIDDLDSTPTVTNTGRVGDAINANIRGLVWHDGFFWGADATTDTLRKIILSTDGNPHTLETVGSYSQFVGPITNPQGFGVVNGVAYIAALDNDGSLWELQDFKFTDTIADQSWTVGEAVSIDAPVTEDGATPITFAITPALPVGMTFDTTDGSIDGTPTTASPETTYTLTATDNNGIITTTTFQGAVGGGTQPPPQLVATTLEVISGNNQDADVSTQLSNPLVVRVLDQNGDPFSGAEVTFSASPSGGRFSDETVTTGANGQARTRFTLGSTAGDYTITASVTGLTAATFTATANEVLVATTLQIVSGNNQTDTEGETLANPLIVRVLDQNRDALSGVEVSFAVSPNDATLSTETTITGANGRAQTTLTLGNTIGTYTVTVSVAGLDTVSFTATATREVIIPAVTSPDAPRNRTFTITHNSILARWNVPSDDGGEDIERYDIRIDGGRWINAGLDLEHLFENLEPNTEYTIEVAAVNSEGRGRIFERTVTTDAYVPPPPVHVAQPPVWQTGNALRRTISAGETATVDIGALVSDAEEVDEIFGVQYQWMEWNEATQILTLKDAPIVREDTDIKIRFLASNVDGDTPADYIITLNSSVLASLHNTLFFEEPLNYEPGRVQRRNSNTVVTELTDNDKTTFSTHTDFDIDMADAQGNPTAFDYVGIIAKGENIRYSITPIGGSGTGFSNRNIQETVKNIGGKSVSTIVDGFTYELYPLPSRVTATSIRLQINGTNLEVYAVMLLKLGWEFDANSQFMDMEFDRVDRTGQLSETPDGTIERDQVLGAEPFKFEAQYTIRLESEEVDEWMDWAEANVNCGFAREFSRQPQDMFLAFFPTLEMPNGYLGLVKSVGETVEFGIAEQ